MNTPLLTSLLSKKAALDATGDGIEKLLLIGGALVLLGVGGETIFGVRAFFNKGKIQEVQRSIDEEREAIARSEAEASANAIARLNKEAGEARKEAAHATERTGRIEKDAELLRKQNLDTEERLAEAKETIGKEQDKRLELEKSLASRLTSFKEYTDGTTNIDGLKPYAGVEVVIEPIPDAEAERAAWNIGFLAHQAGWKVVSITPNPKPVFDGVYIYSYLSDPRLLLGLQQQQERNKTWFSDHAASALEKVLRENDWEVKSISANSGELTLGEMAPGRIKISVGFKPIPYFQDSATKESEAWHDEKVLGIDRSKPAKIIRRQLLQSPAGIERYTTGPVPPKK